MEISLTSEYLVDKLKPEGTFLMFSLITFTGVVTFYKVLKETVGLTDKQKKQLYLPQNLKEETS